MELRVGSACNSCVYINVVFYVWLIPYLCTRLLISLDYLDVRCHINVVTSNVGWLFTGFKPAPVDAIQGKHNDKSTLPAAFGDTSAMHAVSCRHC